MSRDRDPVAGATDATDETDLHGIATWEPRSLVDRLLVGATRAVSVAARVGFVILGIGLLAVIGGFAAVSRPVIGAFTVLSAIPALGLAGYVSATDITEGEPPTMLAATFLLGIVTATFAAVVNGIAEPITQLGFVGSVLLYFLVVGPVEETVKLAAVWLYAYRDDRFRAVIDGAVYGAMAGLGFAFIENALYIARGVGPDPLGPLEVLQMGVPVTFTRALAGPGHVIYSAFAGYYLGLAKFTPEYRVPIVAKGLGIAALIHALYNTTVGVAPVVLTVAGLPPLAASFVWIVAFDAVFAGLLIRKLRRYRQAYADATAAELDSIPGFTAPAPADVADATSVDTPSADADTTTGTDATDGVTVAEHTTENVTDDANPTGVATNDDTDDRSRATDESTNAASEASRATDESTNAASEASRATDESTRHESSADDTAASNESVNDTAASDERRDDEPRDE